MSSRNLKVKPLKDRIPSVRRILERALNNLLREYKVNNIKELVRKIGFSRLIIELEKEAHNIYRDEERRAIKNYLQERGVCPSCADRVLEILLEEGNLTKEISNIRRARAGITAESILLGALKAYDIPCERGRGKIKGYRPDIVVPSNYVLRSNPEKAVAIAVKRTLRERWAEDIDVFKIFPHGKFVLITPDPDLNEEKAKDMIQRGMKEIYIPDELYDKLSFVNKYPQIKRLSSLPSDIKELLKK